MTRRLKSSVAAAGVLTLAIAACGSPAGSLLGGQNGGGGGGTSAAMGVSTTGSGEAGGGGGGSGSTGDASTDGGSSGPTPEQLFDTLEGPLFTTCGGCHGVSTYSALAPKWLLGPNRYATVKAFPGIIVPDPENSLLLSIGDTIQHAGGAGLVDVPPTNLRTQVANWLVAEAAAVASVPLPETSPFPIKNGVNAVNISQGGVNGASISFTVDLEGSIITFTDMTITAPPSMGLEIVHPIFAISTGPEAGAPSGDVSDSFSNLDQTVPAGQTQPLGVGLMILDVDATIGSNWSSSDQLVIEFTSLTQVAASDGGTDAGGGGCKALTTFVADAIPAIKANQCLNCHQGENATATANMDLTMLGTNNAAACAQALSEVNLTNPTQSNILLAPTGGLPPHPFTSASASFTTMMLEWIKAE